MYTPKNNNLKTTQKDIIKNAIVLYLRTAIALVSALIATRIVLNNLGTETYGVYTLLRDLTYMFFCIDTALGVATLRFLSYKRGEHGLLTLEKSRDNTISILKNIYIFVNSGTVILFLFIGLVTIKYIINIPPGLHKSAMISFCFILPTFALTSMGTFFSMILMAYERFNQYAMITIADAGLKLIAAICTFFSFANRLYLYVVALLIESFLILLFYKIKVYILFHEPILSIRRYPFEKYREFLVFIGWSMFGNISRIINQRGTSMIVNLFFGVVFNAVIGLAMQIYIAIILTTNSIVTAMTPKMTKDYAQKDMKEINKIINNSSKLVMILSVLCSAMFIANYNFITKLWLKNAPEELYIVALFLLLSIPIEILSNPLTVLIQATGKIKDYYIFLSLYLLMMPVMVYIMYRLGFPVYTLYIVKSIFDFGGIILRLFFLKKIASFPIKSYLREILLPCFVLYFSVLGSSIAIQHFGGSTFICLLYSLITVVFIGAPISCFFLLTKDERKIAIEYLQTHLA